MSRFTRRAVLLPLLLTCLAALGGGWLLDLQGAEDQLIQRRYREAAAALEEALPDLEGQGAERARFLLGEAWHLSGDHDKAVAAWEQLLENDPNGTYRHRARFRVARSHAAAGRRAEAAALYREEIARLIGLERKEQVAKTYLTLAQASLDQENPNPMRAVAFYDRGLDLGLPEARDREVGLAAAKAALQAVDEGKLAPRNAVQRFRRLKNDDAPAAFRAEVLVGLGGALRRYGDGPGARSALRDALALSPVEELAGDAAWEIALSHGVPTPQLVAVDRAVDALETLRREHPGHREAAAVGYRIAQCLLHVGRTAEGLAALRRFLADAGEANLPEVPAARALVGDVLARQGEFTKAIGAWREYLAAHPSHGEWERVQKAIVDSEWQLAWNAWRRGKEGFEEARERFAAFTREHPLDNRNPTAALVLGKMLAAEDDHVAARSAYERCVQRFPGKNASSEAQYRIGEIFEQHAFDYAAALTAYRKVTWGRYKSAARRRIAALEEEVLQIQSEQPWRTDEAAGFTLTTRNIGKVRVRVFRLDLESYFRATYTASGVDRLDIEVIEPDHVFETSPDPYVPHRETERFVKIPTAGPGAYVVKVDDQKQEATGMVLVTDIALIAKSSRQEFLVFAQDVRQGKPVGGAEVILSEGSKILAEGTTGEDGVWRFRGEELKRHDQLRVFAVAPSGSGAGNLRMSGLGYSPGLTAKGYLFTDRPAYEPGEQVQIKGIAREVAQGRFVMPRETGYRATVTSPSGVVMLDEAVSFTDFGSFALSMPLAADAPVGGWSVTLTAPGQGAQTYRHGFTVARYEIPKLAMEIEPDTNVVFRGEAIEGHAVLRYFDGQPAGGKQVKVQMILPDGVRDASGTVDQEGRFRFSFPTTSFGEEAVAMVRAWVPGEQVGTSLTVPVVVTALTAQVATVRDVYLVGEPFSPRITIEDRAGKPAVGVTGKLTVLQLVSSGRGRISEVQLAERDFLTGEDGVAKLPGVRVAEGGRVRLRVAVEDRFGNLVTTSLDLTVSGEEDKVKLRMLTERERYRVGEKVRFTVVNRGNTTLALRTDQGDGILGAMPVEIPKGRSTLEVELGPEHAPNCAIALALVDGTALHLAERELQVARDLQVAVEIPATARPGETVKVGVTTLDPAGQPVAAEVALALVDEALLAIHPETTQNISAYFWGDRREVAFRTVSSCTWVYRGTTRKMSEELASESYRGPADAMPAESGAFDGGSDAPGAPLGVGGGGGGRFGGRGGRPAGPRTPGPGSPAPQPEASNQAKLVERLRRRASELQGGLREEAELEEVGEWDAEGAKHGGNAPKAGRLMSDARTRDKSRSDNFTLGFAEPVRSVTATTMPPDQPRTAFDATGAWLSSVVTDATGKAEVEIPLPDNITSWRLIGRGVTAATDVGQVEGRVVTRKDLIVDVRMPRLPVEGDRITYRVTGRDATGQGRELSLSSEVSRDGAALAEATTSVQPGIDGSGSMLYSLQLDSAGELGFSASVAAGGTVGDQLELPLQVQRFGVQLVDGASGSTQRRVVETLQLAAEREIRDLQLQLWIGPDPSRDLVRIALGQGFQPWNCRVVTPTLLATASRGATAYAVRAALGDSGRLASSDRMQLEAVGEQAVRRVLTMQRSDGGWAWIGTQGSDVRTSAAVLRLLLRARAAGLSGLDTPISAAGDLLVRTLRRADRDVAADALWALAAADRAAFDQLNRVHRERARMDPAAQARLALAWLAAGRRTLAGELRGGLLQALQGTAAGQGGNSTEAKALALKALLILEPRSPQVRAGLDALGTARVGTGWGTPEATLAATTALLQAGREPGAPGTPNEVVVTVNGQPAATLGSAAVLAAESISIPAGLLRRGPNEVSIEVRGGGTAHYHAMLTGVARGFTDADRNAERFRFKRQYLAARTMDGGKPLNPGFSTVTGRDVKRFDNPVTGLAVGETLRVRSSFSVRNEDVRNSIGPIVIEEPIPAGCAVVQGTLTGGFAHSEIGAGRIVLYYPAGRALDIVSYELEAQHVGEYRALPTRLVGALQPEFVGYGEVNSLTLRDRGEAGGDTYRWTPDELFQLASRRFDEGKLLEAGTHLDQLLEEWSQPEARLNDRTYREVARMMLLVSIERDDSPAVVRFFEELKNRYPEYPVPFDRILRVGEAYQDLDEHEAALLVFQAAAEASFLKDAAVAQVLGAQGEQIQSVRFLERLLSEYPDLNTMRMSHYGLAQQLAAMAAELRPGAPVDPKVGSPGELRAMALAALRECQVLYPEDPLAEEIAFAEATTFLEAGDLEAALSVAKRALATHTSSTFVDEYLYTSGYAQFALGRHDAAFEVLKRVATEEFPRPGGGRGPSESREHAIYLRGQIHHARGEAEQALVAYRKVEERFSDASEARDYFLHKRLGMPEVTKVATGDDVTLELTHRNLAKAELQVFKVDLMRLYLLQKSLNDIRGVQLQGISPTVLRTVELGDGRDYRDRKSKVSLELEGIGAWLVVARGEGEVATGLVLRSGLDLDIQEDTGIGRLRANVKRGKAFVARADVRVVASGDQRIRSGKADLRGVFVADDLVGMATVIARVDGEYAFFRGERIHQPTAYKPPALQQLMEDPGQGPTRKGGRFNALEQNFLFNGQNRARQQEWLNENVIQNDQRGVEVQRTR